MLKVRLIPTLLWKDIGLVKGKGFDSWRRVGTVLPAIKVYNSREVDELILVDISATQEKRDLDYAEIQNLASECFVPLTVGGGVNSLEQFRKLLLAGADKVCINSAAYDDPELVTKAASQFGSQCVTASVDVRRDRDGKLFCYSHAGSRNTGRTAAEWCRELEKLGAGEILLTSIDRDGTMTGYDIELIRTVSHAVKIPVIASGGAGNYAHMIEAVRSGANAVAAAAMFHYTESTPLEAKKAMARSGIPVRNLKTEVYT